MAKTRTSKTQAEPDFEQALAELEQLVARLEEGELSLEESLQQFERGINLARRCQEALKQAELRVKKLTEREDGGLEETPFEAPDDGTA